MAEQFGIRLAVSPADLAASINNAIKQINSGNSLDKIKIGADTSELETAIKRIKSELASITGRSSTPKIELGTSRADGQITLDELTAFRKAEEALANPVGMAAVQAELNKTVEIVKNLTSAISTFKREYSAIGGGNTAGNIGGLIDANAIGEKIKTAVSGLNITKPVEIPVVFKGVQEAVTALQQQVNGTVININTSAVNGTHSIAGETVSNAVKRAAEQTTEALKQEDDFLADVNNKLSERRKLYLETGDVVSSIKSGSSSKNVIQNYLNGEEISRTLTVNYEQQRKEMDKTAAAAASLKGKLDRVRTAYSNLQTPVPIKNDDIAKLDVEYEKIKNRINELKTSNASYNEEAKAEIENQIKSLKQLATLYKEANSGGTSMRKKDVATIQSISSNVLDTTVSRISDARVFSAVQSDITQLKQALDGITDRSKLNDFLNQFDIFKSKVTAVTTQLKSVDNTIGELQKGMASLNKISDNTALYKNKDTEGIRALLNTVEQLKASYQTLMESLKSDSSPENLANVREQMTGLKEKTAEMTAESDRLAKSLKQLGIDESNIRRLEQFKAKAEALKNINSGGLNITNPNTGMTFGAEIDALIAKIPEAQAKGLDFTRSLETGLKTVELQMKAVGATGNTFLGELKEKATKFIKWTAMTLVITKARMYFRQLFTTVYDLDTALVDLKKTFNGTTKELDDFYFEANKLAKQMGITTAEVIKLGSAWSRLGYSSNETMKKMAEMSAMFAAISPDMNTEQAQNGLVSIMKAFDIDPDNVLDGILSKVNIIGNTAATSNGEIVEILQKSSAAMKSANNTLEETIALGTAGVEILRDSSKIGNSLKTISMRLRGYSEETEAYTEDVEELSGKIADLTKTASKPGGISLFSDANKTTYKSTYQILKEVSEIWNELDDKDQAALQEAIGGKHQGNVVAAIAQNFEAAEKALVNMANSAGSAEAELATYQESAEYLYNQFKETFTSIAQNAIKKEDLKNLIKFGTSMLEIVDKIVSQIGLIPTILSTAVGVIAAKKNVSNNLLGFNVNNGKLGMNFFGAQVGSGWKQQRAEIKAFALETKTALNDLWNGMQTGEQETEKFKAAYATAMKSNSAEVRAFAQNAKEGTASVQQMSAAMNSMSGVGAKLKGVIASLGNALLSIGLSMGITALINLTIGGISKAINSYKNLNKELKELDSEYESIKSEITQINEQLTDTQTKISRLGKLPKLSFLQAEELEQLKKYNDELERQKKERETEAEANKAERYKKARKQFDEMFYSSTYSSEGMLEMTGDEEREKWSKDWWKFWEPAIKSYRSLQKETMSSQEDVLKRYETLLELSEGYQELIEKYGDDPSYSENATEWKKNKKEIDDILRELKLDIAGYAETWNTMLNDLNLFDDHDEHTQKAINYLQDLVDRWNDVSGITPKTLGGVFEKFGVVKQYLIDLANEGRLTADVFNELTEDDIEGIEDFRKALTKVKDLTVEDVIESIFTTIEDGGGKVPKTTKTIESFTKALEKLKEVLSETISKQEKLSEAFKKIQLGGVFSGKEMYELLTEIPLLSQYVKDLGNSYTVSAEGFKNANQELLEELRKDNVFKLLDSQNQLELLKKRQEAYLSGNTSESWYADVVEKTADVSDDKLEESIKTLEEDIALRRVTAQLLNDINWLKEPVIEGISEAYEKAKSTVSGYNEKIQALNSAIKSLNEGTSLSYEEMVGIVDIAPELEDFFDGQNGRYTIAIEKLEEWREKSYKARNEYIDGLLEQTQAEITAARTTKSELESVIKAAKIKGGPEGFAEQISAEKKLEVIDAQIDALIPIVNKLEALRKNISVDSDDKSASEEMQNRIDYYKSILSAIEAVQDKYTEALDNEIDALQESKDALKENNDERQRELDLIEARNNLENAKKHKVMVYSEGSGFKQVADQKAVKEAEEKYRDVITDIQEAEIDKQIEIREKQKEALERQNKDLTELEDNIEKAKVINQAMQALGLKDESELLNLPANVREGIIQGLTKATLNKEQEDNKDNKLYTPADLNDVLKSLGATVTAEDLKAMKSELPTEAVYNAAVKGFSDSLKEFADKAVQNVTNNNNGMVVSPTFNIYDASDPNKVAKVVDDKITDLLTRYNNSIK